jgi:hypothetical protein
MCKLPISLQHEKVVFSTTTFCIFLNGLEISLKFCISIPMFKFCEEKVFKVILALFKNFKAQFARNDSKFWKTGFTKEFQNYFYILLTWKDSI